ncbi:MAG: phospho-sugar mutase [Oscillospiraceae bacterium]|nr:phospho-sugar mutase [Oscillospiraceae bacterium]
MKDKSLLEELKGFDDEKINLRFGKDLQFGTAGLRSKMGVGTDRINIYTIRKASQAISNFLKKIYKKSIKIAIAFDSRNNSKIFANEALRVFSANSITVFFNKTLQPVPVLSYCIRYYSCTAGVMITASHNSMEYNGYKFYGPDGGQVSTNWSKKIQNEIENINEFFDINIMKSNKIASSDFVKLVDNKCYESYINCVKKSLPTLNNLENDKLRVVFTPLNGTGRNLVLKILIDLNFKNIFTVKEQEYPDGNFPTCKIPNPENEDVFHLSTLLAKKKDADIIIATDPDADRIGIKVKNKTKKYENLTGNQVGVLLLDYILTKKSEQGVSLKNKIILKSVVSTPMVEKIANKFETIIKNVPIGFRYISEEILKLEKNKHIKDFLFGFEESCGYLFATHSRDKDAVATCILICQIAAYYKKIGTNLLEKLNSLYKKYGYYLEKTINFKFSSCDFSSKISNIMKDLRNTKFENLRYMNIKNRIDFLSRENLNFKDFPAVNMISFELQDSTKIIIRPSGTEPKLKTYIMIKAKSQEKALIKLRKIEDFLMNMFKNYKNIQNTLGRS